MNEHMKKKLELLKELTKFLEKNKIKYYVEGDILINVYNNIEIDNNLDFNVAICNKELKNLNNLNTKNRSIVTAYDNNNTIYYYQNNDNNSNNINCVRFTRPPN